MRLSDAQSTARVAMADLTVEFLLGGIRECEADGHTLTSRQQQILMRNCVMAYRSQVEEAERMLELDDRLASASITGGGGASASGDRSP